VIACHAAHGHGLQNTHEPVAVVSFARGRELMDPMALQLPQVMILIEDLRKVLHVFHKDIPLVGIGGPSEETPPTMSPPRALNVHRPVRPSKRSDMPRQKIGKRDVEVLKGLLKNTKDHVDFMRFIGGDIPNEPPPQTPKSARKPRSPSKKPPAKIKKRNE
jgi:hypothetical protein